MFIQQGHIKLIKSDSKAIYTRDVNILEYYYYCFYLINSLGEHNRL